MKTSKNIIFFLPVLFILSCSPVEENVFDETSANRINTTLKEVREVLTGAKSGWLMKYFPSPTQAYGGYNILLSFDESAVTIAGENNSVDTAFVSLYSLKQSAGPVITFDTYNEVLHYYSNPKKDVSGVGNNGFGMEGDFEFLIMDASPDSIVLKGKKTSNRILMLPFDENVDWQSYLTSVKKTREEIGDYGRFDFRLNNQVVGSASIGQLPILKIFGSDGSEHTLPFMFTRSGIEFYEPFVFQDVTIRHFEWDVVGKELKADNIDMVLAVYPDYMRYSDFIGDWTFNYNDGTTDQSINVTMKGAADKEKIVMASSQLPMSITFLFDKETGSIKLNMHGLKMQNGDLKLVCLYDSTKDKALSLVTPYISSYWDGASSPKVLTFKDSGLWSGHTADGFIIEILDSDLAVIGTDGKFLYISLVER